MKSHRFMLLVVLLSLSTVAFAQSDMEKSDVQKSSVAAVLSEAQKSFATMKSLAGEWEGPVTVADAPEMSGTKMHASLRVTSRGNALVHEFQEAGTPLDAAKYDHPVTMLYVDGDQLTLISLLRRREPAAHDRQDDARRQDGQVRTEGHQREHGVPHAPFGVHGHRRQSSPRRLDVHDERQADPRALRPAQDQLTESVCWGRLSGNHDGP